jgi:HK97 family phage prohead protease
MLIRRKDASQEKWEVLTVPFTPFAGEVGDDDLMADFGELPEGSFRGVASMFGEVIDAFMPTVMKRGAFTKTLQERSRSIPILWQHDIDEPIGRPTRIVETDEGLLLQAAISRTNRGRDALILMRDGVVGALSIGFDPVQFDFEEQPDGSMKRFIREARLHEISVVTLGADPNALITEVRAGQVSGTLRKYWEGVESLSTGEETDAQDVSDTLEEPTDLAARFATFMADTELTDEAEIAVAFAATLQHEAAPELEEETEEPRTLSEVEFKLMEAEILAAELELGFEEL